MSLQDYHRKRNFKRTQEPMGKQQKKKTNQLLYVIQKHAASHLHYDFRIELDGVLKSWAVPKGPSLDPKVKHLAVHVEDHPLEYADFEGIIPKGEYGGGTVMVWDAGYWQPLDKHVHQAYYQGNMTFALHGKKLHGTWKLIRLKNSSDKQQKQQWLLFKIQDEFSKPEAKYNITKEEPYSVLSDRDLKQIANQEDRVWSSKKGEVKSAKKTRLNLALNKIEGAIKTPMPTIVKPELATLTIEAPESDQWLHELKWDGYRIISRIDNKHIILMTRRGNDWTAQFPAIERALKSLKLKNIILDGEVIAIDKHQKTNFQILQNSMEDLSLQTDLIYYIFDLLYYDNYNLMNVPLLERKKILQKILTKYSLPKEIRFNDHIIGNGSEVFKKACQQSLEGIVSKNINSRYIQKRTKEWLKVKCTHRQEFIIGGYTDPKSSRQFFGALLLGYYNKEKQLIYCGRVGTGFTQTSLQEIADILFKLNTTKCPFNHFQERITKDIHWIKPKIIAEIEFLEMTNEGILRHPSFKGLREDKKAQEVSLELPKKIKQKTHFKFTNLDRVLYPEIGVTKQDLANYYQEIAPWILPHIINRPLTIVRCPSGVQKQCFYQKHHTESVPNTIKSVPILEHGKKAPYIYIDDLDGLMGLVQMGALELHPWGSKINDPDKPDRIIIDLDPSPEVKWSAVIECAEILKQLITHLGLKNFLKTTGGKGLHIIIPIKPTKSWDTVAAVAKRIADIMVEFNPAKYIAEMSKAKRKGKIFIDYLRNARGATAIAAYSTRANAQATIAIPLSWDELSTRIRSDSFNINNINRRLRNLTIDPWEDFFKTKQAITNKVLKKLDLKDLK